MINFFKRIFGKMFKSLRVGMLVTIIISMILAVSFAMLTHSVFKKWIDNEYNSEESKKERYENYVADLQSFVDKNNLSSDDTAEILDWVSENRNIYLFIYKNDEPFFDSSAIKPDNNENKPSGPSSDSAGEGKEDSDGENSNEDSSGNSDTEKEDGKEEDKEGGAAEEDTAGDKGDKDNSTDTPGGGLTVQYPTREEIIESAKNNGQMPLEMSDGSLLVSIADFTEYIYYDIANIVAIAVGVLVLTVVLMLYFQNIVSKISTLAKDVANVYEVDMNTPIRTRKGNNELAALTRNVEEMRSSMMQSLEKEKEAINANTELITSMSHDIRTPLTVLLGYLDIMKESTDDVNMQEYIKASEVTAMRLKNLSDDMFRYFLVFGDGNIQSELLYYSARTLFDQLFSEHVLLLSEKGYRVTFNGFDKIGHDEYVYTDAPKIMRVVDNVFSNIYKYADKSEKISIEASTSGVDKKYVAIEIVNRISSSKNEAESNGVGLKTCAKLCEALGARFEYGELFDGSERFAVKLQLPIVEDKERVEE